MVIQIGKKVYLQKYEIANILDNLRYFPDGLLQDIFEHNNKKNFIYISNFMDSLRFDYVFETPENIDWIMGQDWIIDYDVYIKKPFAELKQQVSQLQKEYFDGIDKFNVKGIAYKKEHFEEENVQYNKLHHKIISIEYLIAFREGKIDFVFPHGYRGQTTPDIINIAGLTSSNFSDTIKVAKKNLGSHEQTSEAKEKPDFFERLFGHSAQ